MSESPTTPVEWVRWYAEVGRLIGRPASVTDALQAVTQAAVSTIPGARWASITRGTGDRFSTMASSSPTASSADGIQYDLKTGPCVEAATSEPAHHSADLATDTRWDGFGPRVAAEFGIRSVLSTRMMIEPDDLNASLNLYADHVDAFSEDSILLATMFTVHAAVSVTAIAHQELAQNLQSALDSNREIGLAMGILMTSHHVTRDDAFALLRIASQNANRKLRDVAAEVGDTGSLPEPLQPKRRQPHDDHA